MRCVQLELKQRHLATGFVQPFDNWGAMCDTFSQELFLVHEKMIRKENFGLLSTKIGYNGLTHVTNSCCSI